MAFRNIVLSTIRVDEGGFVYNEALEEYVHLRQGDADGACGAYCLFMGLLVKNLVSREVITSLDRIDGRTRVGRLVNRLNPNGRFLVCDGLAIEELVNAVNHSFGVHIAPEINESTGGQLVHKKLSQIIDQGDPFLLALTFAGGGRHWILVIGYEVNSNNDITKFLVLDPGCDSSKVSPWNAILDLNAYCGPLPYKYCTGPEVEFVALGEVLVLRDVPGNA